MDSKGVEARDRVRWVGFLFAQDHNGVAAGATVIQSCARVLSRVQSWGGDSGVYGGGADRSEVRDGALGDRGPDWRQIVV